MAKPLNRLQKAVKLGTGLFGTSEEEMSSLAQAAGRSQQPSSPLEGSVLGGTPDQAKMLGTPASRLGAMRQQVRAEFDLGTQQRQEQARKAQTAEEQAAAQRQQGLVGLGDMQSRVQQIADKMLSGQAAPAITKALAVNDAAVDQVVKDPSQSAQVKQLLEKLGNNTATNQDILAVANLLGFTKVTDIQAVKDQLKASFLTQAETAGQFMAGQTADQILVSNLAPEQINQLGFQDAQDLATRLGVDPAQVGSMSVQQVQQAVSNLQQAEYARVQRLKETMASPAASQADKIAAASELRNLGGAGVRATEADYARLNEAVQRGDEVQFGGEVRTLDELLSDQYISGLVKNYFNDPATAAALAKSEPEFTAWIEKNRAVLEGAAKEVDDDIAAFSQIQLQNKDKGNLPGGNALSQEAVDAIFGGQTKLLQAQVLQDPRLLTDLRTGASDGAVNAITSGINNLTNLGQTGIVTEMTNMSLSDLARRGLATSGGMATFTDYTKKATNIQRATDPVDIISVVTNRPLSEIDKTTKQAKAANTFFRKNIRLPGALSEFDKNGDGRVDDVESIAVGIKNRYKPRGAADISSIDDLPNFDRDIASVSNEINSLDSLQRQVLPYLEDGNFDEGDANEILRMMGDDLGSLEKLTMSMEAPTAVMSGYTSLRNRIDQLAQEKVDEVVKNTPILKNGGASRDKLANKINYNPARNVDQGRLNNITNAMKLPYFNAKQIWHYFNDVAGPWGDRKNADFTTEEWNEITSSLDVVTNALKDPRVNESPVLKRKLEDQKRKIDELIFRRERNINNTKKVFDDFAKKVIAERPGSREAREWEKWLKNGWAAGVPETQGY